MDTRNDTARVKVLVPDDLGLEQLDTQAGVAVVVYTPGEPWPRDHVDATVVVVGFENATAVGSRLADLPGLRLIQTLNAGFEQWLPCPTG